MCSKIGLELTRGNRLSEERAIWVKDSMVVILILSLSLSLSLLVYSHVESV